MKHPLLRSALAALALMACATPASSQIIPENSFYAEDIPFIYDNVPEPTRQSQNAGVNLLNVPFHESGFVFDFCADFFTGTGEINDYTMSAGFGSLGSIKEAQIRALMSNSLPTFVELLNAYIIANGGDWAENTEDAELAEDFNEVVGYAAGMQIALWEIVHEESGQVSIDTEGPIAGSFGVEVVPAAPPNPRAEIGRANAEDFLTAVRSGNWTDVGGIGYYYVDPVSPAEQDRLWLTQVPEPSTALLGALGLLAVLRRRRD